MTTITQGETRDVTTSMLLHHEVEQFLFHEAALLDERKFEDWYALLADDLHYFMPVRFNRLRREQSHEFSRHDELAHFDDDKQNIWKRIKRIRTPQAWAEDPPSRTRHMLTNIRCEVGAKSGEVVVHSCFHVYRARQEHQVDTFIGGRMDLLRRSDSEQGWEIVKRHIYLDQTIVLANNISFFF